MVKILGFAGSTRQDSYNKKLVKQALEGAKQAGAHITYIDLADYPLPLYDGDLEAEKGLPELAKHLKQLFITHDGFLIASPEYNSSYSAVFKNTIDWISRKESADEPKLVAFSGKIAGIMSASPGILGGLRGLVHVRSLLENIHTMVLTNQIAVGNADKAFLEDNTLKDEELKKRVYNLGKEVADTAHKLTSK